MNAHFTFEPSTLPVGKLLREVLSGEFTVDPYTHALLFAADREEHLRVEVQPKVEHGDLIVCDRYVYASMAYQGAKGVPMIDIWSMNGSLPHFRVPDLVLLLDIHPLISLKRTSHREDSDIFETPDYLNIVRDNYLKLVKQHDMKVIDASRRFEDVVQDVLTEIEHLSHTAQTE